MQEKIIIMVFNDCEYRYKNSRYQETELRLRNTLAIPNGRSKAYNLSKSFSLILKYLYTCEILHESVTLNVVLYRSTRNTANSKKCA